MAMMSCPITACPFQVHRCYPRVNSSSSWEPCNWLGSHFSLTDEKMEGSEMVDVVWTLLWSSFFSVCVCVVCIVVVFEKEPRASYTVSNCSVPEPHPSSRPFTTTAFGKDIFSHRTLCIYRSLLCNPCTGRKAEVENVRDGDATAMLWFNPGLHVWLENQSLEKLFHTTPVNPPQGFMWPHHLTRWQQHDPWPSHDQWLILPCLVILSIISKLELQFLEHAHLCSVDS